MRKFILTNLFLVFVSLVGLGESTERGEAKVLVTLRKIGNDVLLQSGDTTSWVLPVEKVSETNFLLKFQAPFAFVPEALVETIHHHLVKDKMLLEYLVEVRNRNDKKVMYSYEIAGSPRNSVIPCLQRNPPKGPYEINIQFAQSPVHASGIYHISLLTWFLLPVLLIGIGWRIFHKSYLTIHKPPLAPVSETVHASLAEEGLVKIGGFTFCPEKQILRFNNERIELSAKESKLLKIFFSAPNQILDRSQLMKLVWEDEGVFVGRSLDVFVSRLRKKLLPEAAVRIVNIHGKGYKMEVDEADHVKRPV